MKPLTQFGEADRITTIFNVFLSFYVLTVSPNLNLTNLLIHKSLFVCVFIYIYTHTNIIFGDKEKLPSPYRWGLKLKRCV